MSLSDDTLKKILAQIQTQAVTSQKSLSIVKSQLANKEKEKKILTLQMRELGAVPQESKMYRGVGKMFIAQSRSDIDAGHKAQDQSLSEDITTLGKKSKYLEKQFEEANNQLKDIFHSQRRAQA